MDRCPQAKNARFASVVRIVLATAVVFACLGALPHRLCAQEHTPPQDAPQQAPMPSPVAPIFRHGAGQGVLDPEGALTPVFLSDAEAFDIIAGEAAAEGMSFSPDGRLLAIPGSSDGNPATQGCFMLLDGLDATLGISFAFISRLDANAGRRKLDADGIIEEIDVLGYATSLRARIAATPPDGVCVIFYDPAVTIADTLPTLSESEYYAVDLTEQARLLSEHLLREQVRDFIDWLKAGHRL